MTQATQLLQPPAPGQHSDQKEIMQAFFGLDTDLRAAWMSYMRATSRLPWRYSGASGTRLWAVAVGCGCGGIIFRGWYVHIRRGICWVVDTYDVVKRSSYDRVGKGDEVDVARN